MTVTFLTPTYRRDLERFALLRESIERCAIDIPHVAVVQDEDLPLFRSLPFQRNLTLLSTRDVLPPAIERRRRAWGFGRRHWQRWVGWRQIHGWMSQQLVKLAAPGFIDTPGVVCLDSDFVFVRPTAHADFFGPDGRLQLYETTHGIDVEMAEYLARAMRFLGIPPLGEPVLRYTLAPAPMHTGILKDLQQFIAAKYACHWMDAILNAEMVTEFATYGAYAKYMDQYGRVVPTKPSAVAWFWWAQEVHSMDERFASCIADKTIKLVGIQSNAGRDPSTYRGLFEKVWVA